MKGRKFWIGMIAGIVLFIAISVFIYILPSILVALAPIAVILLLYLAWRLVRAVERIADALERQQTVGSGGHSDPSTEDSS